MKVKLDENGYFTGNYAYVGDIEGSIEVDNIPEDNDPIKLLSYKYNDDNTWEFDSERYEILLNQNKSKEILLLKSNMIMESKKNLSDFLRNHNLISSCHGGVEKEYSVTAEKQQYLNCMISVTKIGLETSDDYRGTWNASGEESTSDWTLDELQQLAVEIETFIRPFVLKQQQTETMINNATTLEELDSINI